MASKEALERLLDIIDIRFENDMQKEIDICTNTIKQDLERLEAFENKNAALKIKVRAWEIQGEKYKQENEKLKKAIDIIKSKCDVLVLTQQEYELLKEVLF